MTFTVTGLNVIGAVLMECSTIADAMDEALNLLRTGYVDVLIADSNGQEYTPAQFAQVLG